MSWGVALLAGVLLAAAHRGMVWCIVPGLLLVFFVLRSEYPQWRLGCLLGLGESLAIYEIWSIDYAAGIFGMLEFVVFRALMLWVLDRCLKVHQASPWVLGGLWSLCEALHAALPFTVPNVIGEIFVDSPLRTLIGWLGAWGLSGWLIGSMRALLCRDRSAQSLLYISAPLLAALAASILEASDSAQPTLPENHIVLVRGGATDEDYQRENIALRYSRLSELPETVDLIVWPETATGKVWNQDYPWMKDVSSFATRQPLLLGASRLTEDGSLANGALYLDESGAQLLDKYRRVWPIEQSYAQGALGRDIKTRFGRARVLICADALDPWSIFSVASKPFEVLIVLADASRFAGSGLAEMHLRRTRVRALEAGTPALFVEQSSTLALIDAKGEVVHLDQATRKPGVLRVGLSLSGHAATGAYWLLVWSGMLLALGIDWFLRRRQMKITKSSEATSDTPS